MSSPAPIPKDLELTGSLWEGLSDEQRALLLPIAEPQSAPAGTRIFNLGETASRLLQIRSGTVALTLPLVIRSASHEVTIDDKEAGAILCWSALVPPHKLSLSGVATSQVELLSFPRDPLAELLAERADIERLLMRNLSRVIAGRVALLEAVLARHLQRWADRQ